MVAEGVELPSQRPENKILNYKKHSFSPNSPLGSEPGMVEKSKSP